MRIRAREWLAVGIVAGSVGVALVQAIADDPVRIASQTRALIRIDAQDLVAQLSPRQAEAVPSADAAFAESLRR